jgi:hypothetical protein
MLIFARILGHPHVRQDLAASLSHVRTEGRITQWSCLLARTGASAENRGRETVCTQGAPAIP